MRVTLDNPASAPAPAGPYTHVARLDFGTGVLLMLSGQAAVDAEGKVVGEGDMTAQATYVFETIGAILAGHGATFADVVSIRTYLTDMRMVRQYGAVRFKHLTGTPPTSTTIEVSHLFWPGALLEVEVVAALSKE
jgi:2-iminobutanoate/2-iminopropanoate deaminase